jgi:hypothetical protein
MTVTPERQTRRSSPVGPPTPQKPSSGICVRGIGSWKNHPDKWPAESLTLGESEYSKDVLLELMRQSLKGNPLVTLTHQLIAAKLNVANGAPSLATATSSAVTLCHPQSTRKEHSPFCGSC